MGLISVSLPSDGTTADVSDYNTPINTIVTEINGGLNNANIATAAAIDGSKIADASITSGKIVGISKSTLTTDSNPYKFRARRVAAQNAGSSTFAIINFDTEDFDTNNNFDTTTNVGRYTVPVSGFYQFNARYSTSLTAGAQLLIALYKNGSIIERGTHIITSNGVQGANLSTLIQATAGDYFEVYSFGTGGAIEIATDSQAHFSGFLVSRT